VQVLPSGTRALASGQTLEVGAELRTGAGGRVRLKFADGSVLVLADRSHMRIEAYSASGGRPREASLLLQMGVIGQRVQPVPGGSWQVRTPTAVTAVRGTEFFVEVGADDATSVHVASGEVAVESTVASNTRSLLPRKPVRLASQANGTRCSASGDCSAAASWASDKAGALRDRVGSLD
jgi:hypothetical protein